MSKKPNIINMKNTQEWIEKIGIRVYDPYDNEAILDRLLDIVEKLNTVIDRVNSLEEQGREK